MRPVRLGIVGLGMAGGVMTGVAATHSRIAIAAAADPQPLLRERFASQFNLPTFADIGGLLGAADIDAVYIATPHQLHAQHVMQAAEAGKHIIVEKPLALTLPECDAMIAAADHAGVALVVGHTHGFDPAINLMRDLIASGEVGEPALLNSLNYTNFLYRPRRDDELDPAKGGGVLFNQTPHQVDLLRTIVGRPVVSVKAHGAALDPQRPVDGCLATMLTFEGGAVAMMSYSGYDGFDSDEWFEGLSSGGTRKTPAHGAARRSLATMTREEERAVRSERFGFGGEAWKIDNVVGQPHFGVLVVTCSRADMKTSARGVQIFDRNGMREIKLPLTSLRPGYAAVLDELADAVGGVAPARHDGRSGRTTVEVCLAIAESRRSGREVFLPFSAA